MYNITGLNSDDIAEQLKNEENTKKSKITPVIEERWYDRDKIIMEYYFTDGRISVDEYNKAHRGKPKKIDYLLLYKDNIPLALLEAKGANHSADEGLQQAVDYARLLDVPFAYASNGDDLIEKDMISGLNKVMKMSDFPTPEVLWDRYLKETGLSKEEESIYTYPYYVTPDGKKPRYYQRIAINKTVQAIARGQKKILLVLATGTGKTYLSFQIIYRFWKTKSKKRILFLADRNILVDQTMRNDFKPFQDAMTKIDGKKIDTSREIYLSLYQQLKNGDSDNYKQLPRDFFDLIVIDECHRGSSDLDSSWHEILDYFNSATQIGLTATPREDLSYEKNNYAYFGEPVYTYSLKQGIDDGFLAPYKVLSVELDIDIDGYTPPYGAVDVNGNPIEIKTYTQEDFDRSIIVQERRELVAKRISDFLKTNNNRYSKTIVFCENINHCEEMKRLLENENADLVAKDSRYIMQITGDNEIGKSQLDNFIDPTSKYPVIAITSKLMSTGVDAQTCENIVLDRRIGSMTEFKQIIGRGTRIKEKYKVDSEKKSKMFFTILDFRKNYLKFSDPGFDGDPVDVTTIPPGGNFPKPPIKKPTPPTEDFTVPTKNKTVVRVKNIDVEIVGEIVRYLGSDGKLVEENLSSCVRNNILSQYPTVYEFTTKWLSVSDKISFASELLLGIDWSKSYEIQYGYKVDNFDIILDFGYNINPPMSKESRTQKNEILRYLSTLDIEKRYVIEKLFEVYIENDFSILKDFSIFKLPLFDKAGLTPLKINRLFKGKDKYLAIINELEILLYK